MAEQDGKWWTLEIKPKRSLLEIDLAEIWKYRDLVSLLVRRDFVALYKQTILGPIWFLVQPLLTSAIYFFVFSRIARIATDGLPPFYFYLAGITAWSYFSECLNKTANTFVENANIYGKVFFPRLIIPISIVLSNLIKFFIQFGLFMAFAIYYTLTGYDINFQWEYMWLFPVLILMMALMGLGFGIIISSLTTKYRDLRFLLTFGVQLMMYGTPVVYPLSKILNSYPEYKWLFLANPMSAIIETFRFVFSGSGVFSWTYLGISALTIFIILTIGVLLFGKIERNFMDTV